MKNRANNKGYIKVSDDFMVTELLNSSHQKKLLKCHIDELQTINLRLGRTNYISKAQREYLTNLYTEVVLNNKVFTNVQVKVKKKREIPTHIGMQMYHAINSITAAKGESFGTIFGR